MYGHFRCQRERFVFQLPQSSTGRTASTWAPRSLHPPLTGRGGLQRSLQAMGPGCRSYLPVPLPYCPWWLPHWSGEVPPLWRAGRCRLGPGTAHSLLPGSWYSCPRARGGFEGPNLMTQSRRDCGGSGGEQPLRGEAAHSLWPFPPERVGLWGSCFWNVCLSVDTVRTCTQVGFCFS